MFIQPSSRLVRKSRAFKGDFLPTFTAYSVFRLELEQTDNWYYSELDAFRVDGVRQVIAIYYSSA